MSIKSLTVKIGADTADFQKELKKVDKEIKTTSKTAEELQKGVELKYDSSRFRQAQKLAQDALDKTNEKAAAIRKQLEFMEKSGNVDTKAYEELQLELAKTDTQALKLNKNLEQLNKIEVSNSSEKLEKLGGGIENVGKKLTGVSIAAGVAVAGLVKLGLNAVSTADDIATLATKYDISTKAVQQWQYIAMQSDVSSETLYKSMKKVRSAFAEQLTGEVNDSTEALKTLGLNINNFDSSEEAFESTIYALSNISDATLQAYYANQLFGENIATEVIPLLQSGKDTIADYINEFEEVGYMSEESVQAAAEFDNVMNNLKMQFQQVALEIGVAMLPVLETFAEILQTTILPMLQSFANWFSNLSDGAKNFIVVSGLLLTALAPVLIITGKMIAGLKQIIPLIKLLKSNVGYATIAIMSMVAAAGLIIDLIANWKNMSTAEKVLKAVAAAAFIAAAAFAAFHSAWSLGIAAVGIVAAIAASVASTTSAAKSVGLDIEDETASGASGSYSSSNYSSYDSLNTSDLAGNSNSSTETYNDNSNYAINIYVDSNEYVSADDLVEVVAQKLAVKLQARK